MFACRSDSRQAADSGLFRHDERHTVTLLGHKRSPGPRSHTGMCDGRGERRQFCHWPDVRVGSPLIIQRPRC